MITRRLFRYLIPHRKALIGVILLLFIATAAELTGPLLIKVFIDDYLIPESFPRSPLMWLGGLYLGLHLVSVVFQYLQQFAFHRIALAVVQQLRLDVFEKVQYLGLSFFDRVADGSLVSRITNDTEAVKELFVNVMSTFIKNTVLMIGVVVAMFLLDAKLALISFILLPLIFGLMQWYRRLSFHVYQVIREKLSEINARLSESIQGMGVIQAWRQEQRVAREFAEINEQHYQANIKNTKLNSLLLRPAVDILHIATGIVVLTYFGIGVEQSAVQIGVMYAFINLLDRMFEPVNQMTMQLSFLQQAVVSVGRVFELLDENELAPSKKGEDHPRINSGRIAFENVTFSYDGKTNVLQDITFVAEPGQTVALVGHTGSGKSSIINLLMHFYSIQQGRITIDGHSHETFDKEELRTKMGLVLQDPFLFVGTIRENIRQGNDALSDEDIQQAAELVQVDSFISQLPKGMDEPVVERGATFSSGQRQLLSFSRTMALSPKILILDEATAHVDTETEEKIQKALNRMRQGRTTIAIAHRLSTIQDADLILVLHQGMIVERGTHQELLAQQGLYHKMYLLQQGMERAVG
ncbi:ABC transporter ATP-binding protein [Marininema halotolerans]|uniref:ATP-binding cassette, subfamily B n=1 Tax=Marininema halotolerans TaxID=1155944 RepID=A0A1I6T1A9_9BACL|nr:ABC transporter transmembrane domain-containing protein [Marininema halotolerans]SFS82797.1 ATP-binding cassette, subfamily B [Marininema halotolerans]